MIIQNNKAFTLVELIVVITILAVLATVAFISFQWYTSSSRDSVRLADLKNISKSFEINRTKWILFPLPENKVDISASGTIFQYQWELSEEILNKEFNIFNGWVDPETLEPYWYAVNLARNKFQLVWFLENYDSVANVQINTSFADNSDKYIKTTWDTLGILLDETTNQIITQSWSLTNIDVINPIDNYDIYINKTIESEWITNLKKIIWTSFSSCKELLASYTYLESWEYNISNFWWVYCDMDFDWGWWTVIWKYRDWSPWEDINFINLGNSIIVNAKEFAALTFDLNENIYSFHTANVNYEWKDKWYLNNYNDFWSVEQFYNAAWAKLWYWVYDSSNSNNKYKWYWNWYAILEFIEKGMLYRLHGQTNNHARYNSSSWCVNSSYVLQSNYPFWESSSKIIYDTYCNKSYNPYTIGLMFR